MTRRGWMSLVGAGLGVLALVGCGKPRETLRYRLTVTVDTPQGPRSGSSVIEVVGVRNPGWLTPEGRGTRSSFRGEAVAVDLPGGKVLFALLKTSGGASDAADYPWLAFRERLKGSQDWLDSIRRMRAWRGQVAVMPATETTLVADNVPALPRLVRFRDVADPASVEKVDPANLAASFGPGFALKAVRVEVTDDPVTTGIGKRLGWLTNPAVMQNPGWSKLPYDARLAINGLYQGTLENGQ